jgi:subfamily B ATP-binding cassette protein MsbA
MTVIRRAISFFRADLHLIILLLVMIGLSVALNLCAAWPLAILIDAVLSPTPKMSVPARAVLAVTGDSKGVQIAALAIGGFLIKVLQEFVFMSRSIVAAIVKYRGTRRLRARTFEHLQNLGFPWHRDRSQGDTMYRVISDTNGPWGVLDTMIGSSAACVTLLAMLIVMVTQNWRLTLCAILITPLLVVANLFFSRLIRVRAEIAKMNESLFTVTLQRALACIGVTQCFGRERREQRAFNHSIDKAVDGATALAWAECSYPLVVQSIFGLGAALIIGVGGWFVYRDQFLSPVANGVTTGELMVFLAYLGQLWDPLGWVIGFPAKVQASIASCDRVFEVLDQKPHVHDNPHAVRLLTAPRALTISDVSFSYKPHGRQALDGISLRIQPGEMVAFVGASGSGKSTLLSLLSRFYDPLSGGIELDGIDLRSLRLSDVRRHVAVVSQESPLLADTIAANLRYGRPEATDAEVRAAAYQAGAAGFIESLPDGYDTIIAEGGGNFSGGQRQRLAIARALVSNAPILVFDEPTSALDPHHEEWILDTLRTLRQERTIILVTHKVASVADCDQIIVLQGGRIAERGTHAELLTHRGVYAEMTRNGRLPARGTGDLKLQLVG